MPAHISSRLSIPLLLIIFAALFAPLTARAWCFGGFGNTCPASASTLSPTGLFSSGTNEGGGALFPVPASAFANDTTLTDFTQLSQANRCSSLFQVGSASYNKCVSANPATVASMMDVCDADVNRNDCIAALFQKQFKTAVPASSASEWVQSSTGAWVLKSDLKSSEPAKTALTPLQKYQAQFALNDTELQRIATSCGSDDLGMGQERCMNYMIGLYRGGNPLSSDVVKVQTYINSQSSASQPVTEAFQTVQQKLDACNAWTDEYGNETQNSTLCKNGVLDAARTDTSETTRAPNAFSSRDLQSELDFCDTYYGSGTSYSNECKEPILRQMGVAEPAQAQTPADYYGPYAPVEDYSRPAPASDIARSQPCVSRASNGECLDEPTGGLRCYSWIASWLPACENYKAESVTTADAKGGVTTSYQPQQFPAPVEERQAPLPRPYTREEEDALSRITITAEETRFTPSETSSGEFVTPGWVTRLKNWVTGDDAESAPTYELYNRERQYEGGLYNGVPEYADFEPDIRPVLFEEGIPDTAEAAPANAPPSSDVVPIPQFGSGTQYFTMPFYDMSKGNDPEQVTGLTSEQLQAISDHCADSPYLQGCILNNIDSVKETGELQPIPPTYEPLPGEFTNTTQSESYIKEANFVPEDNLNAPVNNNGWSLWNPTSWPIWGTKTQARPTRQFSTAVPFSGELFNQSLAAGAFGAFLLKDKEDGVPARPAREPFGNGL